MTVMAVLKVLLFKYTGDQDIIVGSGILGRPHQDLQRVVGMFVNMLAIRSTPGDEVVFADFYKEIVAKSLEAYDNQDVQFDDLVDELNIERDVSRNPIFDVSLAFQNFEKAEIRGDSEMVSASSADVLNYPNVKNTTAKFDLTFFVDELGPEINITIEYYADLFKQDSIQRMAAHFGCIVDQVLEDGNKQLADIDLLTPIEKTQILSNFNPTEIDHAKGQNVHDLFAEQCRANPSGIAVSDEEGSYTYAEVEEQSNKLANFLLKDLELPKESYVGILQSSSKEVIPSILGVLKAGGAFLNLDPNLPQDRLLYMLKDAGVNYLITEKNLVSLANRLQWRGGVDHIICINSHNIYQERGGLTNELMRKDLWDYIGDKAEDAITAGGWMSSYTGEALSPDEMKEYADNAFLKLEPILREDMKVLEIGCASGLTMFRVAPKVSSYHGTDLSSSILEFARKESEKKGQDNIRLTCLAAHEIDTLDEKDFDLIIINSVIQSFGDHNYLRDILNQGE